MSGLPPTPLTPQPPRLVVVVVIQLLSRVRLFETPQAAACQASLSFTITQSLLKLMSIESVMPSKHPVLCHPLLFIYYCLKLSNLKQPFCFVLNFLEQEFGKGSAGWFISELHGNRGG